MNRIFYCYSRPLKNYLVSNGMAYFSKAVHEKTLKKYWMFFETSELNILLEQWKLNK